MVMMHFQIMLTENKFAVGSGAKTTCICYYEQDNNWFVDASLHFTSSLASSYNKKETYLVWLFFSFSVDITLFHALSVV